MALPSARKMGIEIYRDTEKTQLWISVLQPYSKDVFICRTYTNLTSVHNGGVDTADPNMYDTNRI